MYPITAYSTTVTEKGLVMLRQQVRKVMGIKPGSRVTVSADPAQNKITIEPALDIIEVARRLRPKLKGMPDPLKAREYMETHYERV